MDLVTKVCATQLLREDHRNAEAMYQRFLGTEDIGERVDLAGEIFRELEVHGRLEECLAYPALARAGAPPGLIEALGREHGEVRRSISEARLALNEDREPSAERDSRLVRIMGEVQRHVAGEEAQAFPLLAADPAFDLELGGELARLRQKLRMFPPIHQRIDLAVPVSRAYAQWSRFETFPGFIDGVKEARRLDAAHAQWLVHVGGKDVRWTAFIHERIPDQRFAWTSVDGAPNAGAVTFRALMPGSCRMLVEIAFEPQGLLEDLGALIGVPGRLLAAALERFKRQVEADPPCFSPGPASFAPGPRP